ncbi:MAG TPA: LamG domain-containing protein, partial [Chthoniobacterales bacterium]|nr:LamG domain-containing protein [Chthoniobacterales bacterium]
MHSPAPMTKIAFLLTSAAATALVVASAPAQLPQPTFPLTPYSTDEHTVLLEHFDGETSGQVHGTVTFEAGPFSGGVPESPSVFDGAVRLTDTSYISWLFGALPQGTVEFWFKLDNLTNTAGNSPEGVVLASANAATTPAALTLVQSLTYPTGSLPQASIHQKPSGWIGLTGANAILPNEWYHYALTWGAQGMKLYLNGGLAAVKASATTLNPDTGQWNVGATAQSGTNGFNGLMDELRISDIERTFVQMPLTLIRDTTADSSVPDGKLFNFEYGNHTFFSPGVNNGFGNVIGDGSRLYFDSAGGFGHLTIGLQTGGGTLHRQQDVIVIYIDSVAGGLTNTNSITEHFVTERAAISGVGVNSGTSRVTFAPGFGADYALTIEPQFSTLYKLNNDGTITFQKSTHVSPGPEGPDDTLFREIQLNIADLGITSGDSFKYVATLINALTANRSNEFHGSTYNGANIGANPFVFETYNTFMSASAPSPTPTPTPTPTATPTPGPSATPGPIPTIRMSVSPRTVNEGGDAVITFTALPAQHRAVTVRYSVGGSARPGSDYTLTGIFRQVDIPADVTSVSVT